MPATLSPSRRVRSTPYTARVEEAGVSGYTVYNHMLLAAQFEGIEADYHHLLRHVQVWDVACQRQAEISGPDAARLVQMLTPRDLGALAPGRCMYVPLTDADGRIANDPVLIAHAPGRLWLSLADSDAIWLCRGVAQAAGLDASIREIGVAPLAIQGPKADELATRVFGPEVARLGFFRHGRFDFGGHPLAVARSGYSRQGGFEVYVDREELALPLWDALFAAGRDLEVRAGCPNLIERIEGGLLSYGNDMTDDDTPLDCGMGQYCHLERDTGCLGRKALADYEASGKARKLRGLLIDCDRDSAPPLTRAWRVLDDRDEPAGKVTSAAWSPRLGRCVSIAMLEPGRAGTELRVELEDGRGVRAEVADLPLVA